MHVKESFARFVLPHVDQAVLKEVRSTQWLRAEDGSDILPPQPIAQNTPGPQGPGPQGPGPQGPGSGPGGPAGKAPSFPPTPR